MMKIRREIIMPTHVPESLKKVCINVLEDSIRERAKLAF
jgi:hypothetical protein